MAFDFKKEYRDFYLPAKKPCILTIPPMQFLAVRGKGDPNDPNGEYQSTLNQLYGIAYTIKMSKMGDHRMDGYFDFVVPPLEGFWQQDGIDGVDYTRKEDFRFVSVIRVPDFVTRAEFEWAVQSATEKKQSDFSKVEFLTIDEGLCVQCMHIGPYDDEPATVAQMHEYIQEQGYIPDFSDIRQHHEIYLSDPRKTAPEKLKTVIRHPIRQADVSEI